MRPPKGLGARGRRVWREVTQGSEAFSPGAALLLEEACRTADRLDRLDGILRGEEQEFARVKLPRDWEIGDDGELVLVVNGALAEARQQANVLRQMLATLEIVKAQAGGQPAEAKDPLEALLSAGSNVRRFPSAGSVGTS